MAISTVKKQLDDISGAVISYAMTLDSGVIWSVPKDVDNTDYQAILEWVANGGVIEEAN